MTTPGSSRRRRAERVPVAIEGRLEGRSAGTVTVVDLSLTGCLVRGTRALEPGAIFDLRVPLPAFEMVAKVRIADCSRDGTSPGDAPVWLSGIEFLTLSVEHRDHLRHFLEGARRRPGADPSPR